MTCQDRVGLATISETPIVHPELCSGCGNCVYICPQGAFSLEDGNVVVTGDLEACDYCGDCEAVCESGAINCPYEIVIEADCSQETVDPAAIT